MTAVYRVYRQSHYRLFCLKNPSPLFQIMQNSWQNALLPSWNASDFELIDGPREQELSVKELSFLMPHLPLIHEKAINPLAHMLTPYGELLPMPSPHGVYYAYHILQPQDVLDHEKTKHYAHSQQNQRLIEQYAFQHERVIEPILFHLREYPAPILATEAFVQKIKQLDIVGWQFEKCWEN